MKKPPIVEEENGRIILMINGIGVSMTVAESQELRADLLAAELVACSRRPVEARR